MNRTLTAAVALAAFSDLAGAARDQPAPPHD